MRPMRGWRFTPTSPCSSRRKTKIRSRILRCDLSASPVVCTDSESTNDWGTYDYGNSVWVSADGTRLYTAGAATLLVPDDPTTGVCTYGGSLSGVMTGVQSLSEAPAVARVALVPAQSWTYDGEPLPDDDTVVRIHETQYLGLVAAYPLPTVADGSANRAVEHGRFVFSTATMDALYVIAQVDAADGGGGAFSVVKLVP